MYLKYLQNKYKYKIYPGMIDGIETVKIKIFIKLSFCNKLKGSNPYIFET